MTAIKDMLPVILVFIGGLLTISGSLWIGIRQYYGGKESAVVTDKMASTLQDMSARAGSTKDRDELIDLRTRLLQADRRSSPSVMNDIVAQLPQLTADFKRQTQDKEQIMKDMSTDMDLCWMPTVRFIGAEFDRLISEAAKKGFDIKHKENGLLSLTVPAPQPQKVVEFRYGNLGKTEIYIFYQDGRVQPGSMTPAMIEISVRNGPNVELTMARLYLDFGAMSGLPCGAIPKPKDGIPPTALTDAITKTLVKCVEQFLVVAAASDQK